MRLLSVLQMLRLLLVFLFQVLGLLLVPLFHLLLSVFVGVALPQLLVLPFLLLLEFLVVLLLPRVELLLLLLILLVQFWASSVRRTQARMRLKISGVGGRTGNVVPAIRPRVRRRSGLSGRYASSVTEGSRPGSRRDWRSPLIHGSPELAVIAGRLDMFILSGYGSDMSVSGCNLIFRPGTGVDSSIAAVVADSIDRGSIYDRGVVNVMNVYDVHIVHRTVVEEASAVPPPAFVALAEITIAVGDAAIETDMRTPVAFMEKRSPPQPQ